MSTETTLTLSGTRGEEWERILGTRTVPIVHPAYAEVDLGGTPNDPNIQRQVQVVMLDVFALSGEQQDALIHHLARKFGTSREDAASDVFTRGVPIRLDTDTRINAPPNYKGANRVRLRHWPNAWDLRFFT